MVNTVPQPSIPLTALSGERRVVIRNLTWQSYQQILMAIGERRSPRLTYDHGILEITMPLEDHEVAAQLISLFIRILVEELGMKLKTMGSTTLQYPAIDRSPEPDNAFYIQNQPRVAGRTVDFDHDPPPDLVVEVDITHTDIDKNRLYASIGVPEFWRFNGQELRIYHLQDGTYIETETSPTFPKVPKAWLCAFLEQCKQDEIEASRALRSWVKELIHQSGL